MLSVEEGRGRILERIAALDPLELSVTEAHGCVLAETVTSPEDLPAFASAAADGYALRSVDAQDAARTPVSLGIVGDAAPGRPYPGHLGEGEAVRLEAGGALPEGADAVVVGRDVAVVGSSMAIGRSVPPGENVRPAGEDVAHGEQIMEDGQRLRGMDVGVLAAIGRSQVRVRPRPRVVVFSVGDELRDPGQPLGPGLVRDANSFTLSGMVREAGSQPVRAGVVRGGADGFPDKLQSYLPQADIFIGFGGLSGGEPGGPPTALEKVGDLEMWDVAARPGGRLAVGAIEDCPVFVLPGQPVAAAVAFELFLRPALLRMAGRRTLLRPEVDAVLEEEHHHEAGKETYLRVRAWRDAGGWRVRSAGRQGPSIVSSLARANGLAVVPVDRPVVAAGDHVRLLLLEPLEGW